MIFKNDFVDLSKAPREARLLCLALGACHGGTKDSLAFLVPKWTNIFSMAHLNIERINHWFGPPEFKDSKIIEIYDLINKNKHSNLTEGIALSKIANSFYGNLNEALHLDGYHWCSHLYQPIQHSLGVSRTIDIRSKSNMHNT